jgi:hypothetical protein
LEAEIASPGVMSFTPDAMNTDAAIISEKALMEVVFEQDIHLALPRAGQFQFPSPFHSRGDPSILLGKKKINCRIASIEPQRIRTPIDVLSPVGKGLLNSTRFKVRAMLFSKGVLNGHTTKRYLG